MARTAEGREPGRNPLLALAEVPLRVGGTKHFWREQVVEGRIPFVRVKSKYFLRLADIERFLETHRQVAVN